jgi:hypothetical protein
MFRPSHRSAIAVVTIFQFSSHSIRLRKPMGSPLESESGFIVRFRLSLPASSSRIKKALFFHSSSLDSTKFDPTTIMHSIISEVVVSFSIKDPAPCNLHCTHPRKVPMCKQDSVPEGVEDIKKVEKKSANQRPPVFADSELLLSVSKTIVLV